MFLLFDLCVRCAVSICGFDLFVALFDFFVLQVCFLVVDFLFSFSILCFSICVFRPSILTRVFRPSISTLRAAAANTANDSCTILLTLKEVEGVY